MNVHETAVSHFSMNADGLPHRPSDTQPSPIVASNGEGMPDGFLQARRQRQRRFRVKVAPAAIAVLAAAAIAKGQSSTNAPEFAPAYEHNPPAGLMTIDPPETGPLNRFRLTARTMFNFTGGFTSSGGAILNSGQRTPDGNPYNYNDGYVLTDISGNAGGLTWNWGYNNSSQISGNTILMHRFASEGDSAMESGGPAPGFELTYDHELGRAHGFEYGVEVALNYANVSLRSSHQGSAGITQTTDAYSFTAGTTPPPAPYQGTFAGPGFLISGTPASSSVAAGTAQVAISQRLDGDIWGWRVGPYLDFPVAGHVHCSLSAGLSTAVFDVSGSWSETVAFAGNVASGSGSGSDTSLQWGGYAGLNLSWEFYSRWAVDAGVQYQYLQQYRQSLGGRNAELNLDKTVFLNVGVSWRF